MTTKNLALAKITATGFVTGRTLGDRFADIKNVKDFGAVGNGTADDTTAIQAAVNYTTAPYSSANRGTIYFPVGTYKITAPITFETADLNIRFLGEPGATITGNFADALLKRSVNSPIGGIHRIEMLRFVNTHASGIGILAHSCVGIGVRDCYINCWRGIETYNSQCATLDTCTFIAPLASATSVGIMAGNATYVLGCDVSGYNHGIRHQNLGLEVSGGRYEVNGVAIRLGRDENDADFGSQAVVISGLSMESNATSIDIQHAAGVAILGIAITVNDGSGVIGINADTSDCLNVSGVTISNAGSFSTAAVLINNVKCGSFNDVRISVASGTKWSLPSDTTGVEFNNNCTDVPDHEVTRAQLLAYESGFQALPMGSRRRVSNSNTGTWGAEMTTTGSFHATLEKGRSSKWYVSGLT